MYNLPVLGSNKTVEAALPEKVKSHVLYEVVRWQLASRRRGTAATKTRGMVNFTTKKMYAQKHTGRARHGDYGAPIFVGGGTVFGPQPRDYSYTLPKKVRKLGLAMALADRAKEGKFFLVEDFKGVNGKTKEFVAWLKAHNLEGPSILLVTSDEKVARAARNLPKVRVLAPEGLNVYDIMRQEALVMEASAWEGVQAKLGQGEGGEA
ncbi:50S ribosomal protein L4 [Meiothermus ruber]|jgi:large subunit ribosomal protein L4|uniref:Large ribosomal subunit protein uL4 n=1 Tax=Meiothermus ruber (strain ATCC 35948 / DSM 1279 / VKM B-1258 / 21) TaxID=504728 RepID=D3PN41_MEIRD|nr:50S ribosomal protein L4 [Meiothermus ruber]ADD29368.1 ribosomal protein L4/L1e [Meiothermus ruber DSM 1279]AGK05182.1 50S ribosomal protein L4 [Meiothermus ruber DSM 1279]